MFVSPILASLNRIQASGHLGRRLTLAVVGAMLAAAVACSSSSLTSTNPSPIKCQVTVAGNIAPLPVGGGSTTLSISAQPECAWTAATQASWISDITPTSGQGNGQIQIQAGPNPDPAVRQGQVDINGTAIQIVQEAAACAFAVSPQTRRLSAAGGEATLSVTAAGGCAWTATTTVPWLTIASGQSGTGNGTVTFRVDANIGDLRTASLTVAGQAIAIVQDAAACAYDISPSTQSVAAGGASGSLTVTATSGCGWSAVSDAAWLTVTAGTTGIGNGTVSFSAAANTGVQRTGTLTIAGETFTVTQAAAAIPCTFAIAPDQQSIATSGGAGTPIAVTAASTCAWTATSHDAWITLTAGATGSGHGTVTFTVAANAGGNRTGTIQVADKLFTVTQAGCSFVLNPTSASIAADGSASETVNVSTTGTCDWTAASHDGWITVPPGASGTGSGAITYSVAGNTGMARSGSLTIAGIAFSVSQSACTYSLSGSSQMLGSGAAAGTPITVTTTGTCMWTATSSDPSWLTVTSGSGGTGPGSVAFSVTANADQDRSAILTIGEQAFTVNQSYP